MAWTYTPGASNKDAVRFSIGDTDSNDEQLQDEEINYALTANGNNVLRAAIYCCKSLAAKYARKVDTRIDSVSVSYSSLVDHYIALSKQFEKEAQSASALTPTAPYIGGISVSDVDTVKSDPDRVPNVFERDMFNNVSTADSMSRC